VTVPVATRRPSPERVEHDPDALVQSIHTALGRLLRGVNLSDVAAVGLACQRSTCLLWDARSGRPLTPALSWQDRRGEDLCRSLSRLRERIRRGTGLRLSPHYAASKIRWLLARRPDLRRRAARGEVRGGTLDAYLLHRLTGGDSWSTDPTHAARTLLMDLRRLDWDEELLDGFRIPRRLLPPIRPSAFPAGVIQIRGRPLRIAATLGDQQAALIGLGCRKEGDLALNYGTGAFAILNTGRKPRRVAGLLTSIAWSAPGEQHYLLEGTVNSAGSALDWAGRLTGGRKFSSRPGRSLDRLPLVVPAFSGLGAPHWVAGARGAILDLDLTAEPEDLAAGIEAGVASRIGEIVEEMRRHGIPLRRIVAGGGLSGRDGLLTLQAAILGRLLFRSRAQEGTCRGAAILAGHATGALDLETDRRLDFPMDRVAPGSSPPEVRTLARRFQLARAWIASRARQETGGPGGRRRDGLS
jgi:glycerol kinase